MPWFCQNAVFFSQNAAVLRFHKNIEYFVFNQHNLKLTAWIWHKHIYLSFASATKVRVLCYLLVEYVTVTSSYYAFYLEYIFFWSWKPWVLANAWCYWPCTRTVGISAKMLFTVRVRTVQATEIVIYRARARSLTAIVMYRARMRTVIIVPETYLPCARP